MHAAKRSGFLFGALGAFGSMLATVLTVVKKNKITKSISIDVLRKPSGLNAGLFCALSLLAFGRALQAGDLRCPPNPPWALTGIELYDGEMAKDNPPIPPTFTEAGIETWKLNFQPKNGYILFVCRYQDKSTLSAKLSEDRRLCFWHPKASDSAALGYCSN